MSLPGCQTGEQYQAKINADLDARLSAYNGSTMAQFMAKTGLLPSTAYNVTGGRVFVIEGAPTIMTLPATATTPAITNSSACQLLIQAVHSGPAAGVGADNWKIIGTQRRGPCNALPV